jgi:hypothetical protein
MIKTEVKRMTDEELRQGLASRLEAINADFVARYATTPPLIMSRYHQKIMALQDVIDNGFGMPTGMPSGNGSGHAALTERSTVATTVPVAGWRKEKEMEVPRDRRQPRDRECPFCHQMFAATGITPHTKFCPTRKAAEAAGTLPREGPEHAQIRAAIAKVAEAQFGEFTMIRLRALLPSDMSRFVISNFIHRLEKARQVTRQGTGSGTVYKVKP